MTNPAMKKVLIGLASLLVVLLIVPLLIPSDSIKTRVEEAASEATGMKVSIGSLHLKLIPTPGVSVSDIAVTDVPDGMPIAQVASGTVSVAVMPLFSGQIELNGIRFSDIRLRVSEKAKGKDAHSILVNSVVGKVRLGNDKLTLPGWRAELYRGAVDLDAEITPLEGNQRTITAGIKASGIQMQPLITDATGQKRMSGALTSEMKISAKGADEKAIQRSLKVDGPVKLAKGMFFGVNLKGGASMLIPGGNKSGDIGYDRMDTRIKVRGQDMRADDIALVSDALDARGNVHIKADKKLDGEVLVSSSMGLTGAKLLVGGTTDTPLVYPAPSSMVGGVIGGSIGGTAGAAVGAKVGGSVGSAVEGVKSGIGSLFGGNKKENKK